MAAGREAAKRTLQQVRPVLSVNKEEARRRVLNLYKAWYRSIPLIGWLPICIANNSHAHFQYYRFVEVQCGKSVIRVCDSHVPLYPLSRLFC